MAHINPRVRHAYKAGFILAAAMSSHAVWAQEAASSTADADPAAVSPAAATEGSGEIIVTAQKRSERLVDVPLSIVAVTAEQLAAKGVTNIRDIGMISPSIRMDRQGNNVVPGIRGVSNVLIGTTSEANVATYVDGVYQASSNGGFFDLPDVSRVEVLKGPQGTLFGRNATGGAIQVFTLDPGFDLTGKASAYAGNYGLVGTKGFISIPLSQDLLALSLSGFREHADGYNIAINRNNERTGEQNSARVAGKLLFTPWDGGKFILGGSRSKWKSRQGVGTILENTSVYFTLLPAGTRLATRPHEQFDDVNPLFKTKITNIFLRGQVELPIGNLTSISAFYRNATATFSDGDYGPLPLQYFRGTNAVDSWTQEVNFSSKRFGPFQLTMGMFYLNSDAVRDPQGQGGTTVNPPTTPAQAAQGVVTLTTFARSKSQSISGFAEVAADVTDQLSVILGGRYTHEARQAYATRTPPLSAAPKLGEASFNSFTPRVSVKYSLAASTNVYFTYSRGFKGGLFNEVAFSSVPIRPETIDAYEVGFKTVRGPLSLNAATFYYDYKDVQVSTRIGNITIASNAASARIKGFDVDAALKITPELTLTGGIAYLDSHYTSFPNATVNVPIFSAPGVSNGTATRNADVSGNVLIRNPKWAGNLAANYARDLEQGRLTASASMSYTSRTYFNVANTIVQNPYAVLNARLAFAPAAFKGTEISLWGRNLTDADYLNSAQFGSFGYSGQFANPRTFGVEVSYSF